MNNLREIFNIGGAFEAVINWLTENMDGVFDAISLVIRTVLSGLNTLLTFPHPLVMIAIFGALAWWMAKRWVGIFTIIGFLLIYIMGLWSATMDTLGLVITAVIISMAIGIPWESGPARTIW